MLTWRIDLGKGREGKRLEAGQSMTTDESKQILIAVTELKSNMNHLQSGVEEIKKMSTLILETDQRAKSAHSRLDDIKLDFDKKLVEQKAALGEKIADNHEDFKELKGHITWLWRALGTGVVSVGIYLVTTFLGR